MENTEKPIYCSFCGNHQYEAEGMIASNSRANICFECFDLCAEIVKAKREEKSHRGLLLPP